jgi:hypothetical protein
MYVCDYEERLYSRMTEQERDSLEREMLDVVKRVEEDLDNKLAM